MICFAIRLSCLPWYRLDYILLCESLLGVQPTAKKVKPAIAAIMTATNFFARNCAVSVFVFIEQIAVGTPAVNRGGNRCLLIRFRCRDENAENLRYPATNRFCFQSPRQFAKPRGLCLFSVGLCRFVYVAV